jgi:protein dithiol oxidoreductase (disulfide-forming)
MKQLFKAVLTLVAALSLAGLGAIAQAQTGVPQEGKDYNRLQKPVPMDTQGKSEVIEFFAYSCGHCYNFEPMLDAWIKKAPKDVVVKRVPIAFRDNLVPHQRLFYTIEAMGKLDLLHSKVFYAIHTERRALATAPEMAEWASTFGVNKDEFLKYYNSFGVQTKVQRASKMTEDYKIEATPTMSVNGRFVSSGADQRTLQTVDFLLAQTPKK